MDKPKFIAGLMSGTSLNGIDAVLVEVTGTGPETKFNLVAHVARAFPKGLKTLLLKNSSPETSRVDDIARLNMLLAHLYADAVRLVAARANVGLADIVLIGSHGQTVHHVPKPATLFRKKIRATLQIGDPSALAALTGITTVGDFRIADMAVGGQGAPLVPYFDWLAFRSTVKNRLLLNIGGIANVTALKKNGLPSDVVAFDTGPGNMIVDGLMRELFNEHYDRNGKTALSGTVNKKLLTWMSQHPYFKRRPPKSTGREDFGEEFVGGLLRAARKGSANDIVATASEFTLRTITGQYERFVKQDMKADEVIVSGGGARNRFFLEGLQNYFGQERVLLSNELGIPAEAKEALCFAILANETMAGHRTNLPSVTGAQKFVVLGKICPA